MKFYVASSFRNVPAVKCVTDKLVRSGFVHTYDWTEPGEVTSLEQFRRIGEKEHEAVAEADFLVVLLPAGKGSHIELGIALGLGKPVYLYSANEDAFRLKASATFYHLPQVTLCTGTMDELIEQITASFGCRR